MRGASGQSMKVGYARLSTGDPEGLTLEIQLDRLQAAGCQRIYSEVISGNARVRPQWEALKQAITDGLVSEVVALRMDRLSRSWTAIGEVIELFSKPGAPALTLLDEPSMDLNTIGGRTVAGVLSSVAAGERERIVARSTAGLAKRHAAGKRHKLPFGLIADSDGFPVLDRRPFISTLEDRRTWSRAEVAEALWTAWEQSPSRYAAKRTAARQFGIESFQGGSAATWSCNPSLRGALCGGKRDRYGGYPSVKEDAFEALISKERHMRAVATFLRERASNSIRRASHVTPLSGKIVCSACGYRMQLHRLLSRPGQAWTFRCRREGCEQHDRRIQYGLLMEHCRQHLMQRQEQLLGALAREFTPATVDPDLDRRLREQQAVVTDLEAMVARRPSENLRRELSEARSELADLQLAATIKPQTYGPEVIKSFMAFLAPLFSGELELKQDGTVSLPQVGPESDPLDFVRNLLKPEVFSDNAELVISRAIHSVVVKASEGTIEVRDCLG